MRGRRVLILDGEDAVPGLADLLVECGCEVTCCTAGMQGLILLDRLGPPNVILLNLRLEDMGAHEFLDLVAKRAPAVFHATSILLLCAGVCPVDERIDGFLHYGCAPLDALAILREAVAGDSAKLPPAAASL